MYTGIVQGVCSITRVEFDAGVTVLGVELGEHAEGLQCGASVAVNGVCLTVATVNGTEARFQLIQETLQLTNLGDLRPRDVVNVERSFRVGDEVGGHTLSGHIATTVKVVEVAASTGRKLITVAVPAPWMRYLMLKGFVALNGASLTVAHLNPDRLTLAISLIPETLARTTFDRVGPGDRLNLEVDAQTQAVVDTVRAMLPEMLPDLVGRQRAHKLALNP